MEDKEEAQYNMNHPVKKHAYAVTTGAYVGEIMVFVDKSTEHYNFISIPKNINREIPIGKFHFGLDQSIIDYVEELPDDVFSILEKQFEYNQKLTK
jgi:hypothetical protein